MRALTKLRRLAKEFGYKISIRTYGFGAKIDILNQNNNVVGNTYVKGPPLENLLAFKKAVPRDLIIQVRKEEETQKGPISGWDTFSLPEKNDD